MQEYTEIQELNLLRNAEENKKGFFKYVSSKKKARENMCLLLNEVSALVVEDTGKSELLNAFFAQSSVLTLSLRNPRSCR